MQDAGTVEAHEEAAHEKRNWVRLTYRCNDRCVFCLDAHTHDGTDRELWKYDGSTATTMPALRMYLLSPSNTPASTNDGGKAMPIAYPVECIRP